MAGSSPQKPKDQLQDTRRDKFNVRDINTDCMFVSHRVTDVMDPTYRWQDQEQGQPNEKYSDPQEFKSKRRHPLGVNKRNDLNVFVGDIDGTKANSFYDRQYFMARRRQDKDPIRVADIDRARASSLVKGLRTERRTNPLAPMYQYIGASNCLPATATQRLDRFISTK